MSFASEFREFALKGNVMDLAVGVIIGGAFGKIVDSVVGDLIMPIVGKIFGGLDFANYFIPLSGQTATTLVEAKTYRYKGHSRTDPAPYRPDGELDRWLKRDPITILAERMQADGQLTDAELATLRAEALAAVQDATTWALEQPYPPLAAAFEDIWV